MLSLFVSAFLILSSPEYQAFVLDTGTSVWDVAEQDLTGDGKAEILALCCDEKSSPPAKFVACFVADAAGAYTAKPTFRLDLDPSIGALFIAEADGAPPKELVAVNAEGATVYRFENGAFAAADSPRFVSLLPSGTKEPAFLEHAAQDVDGDGKDEWLIPVPMGYEIRTPEKLLARVPCDMVSEIQSRDSVYIFHRLPSCHAFTLAGEPAKCLAFLSDEYADFAHGASWSQNARFKIPLNLEEKWEASTKMDDINADGLPDLVVTQMKGTVNLRAMTQVYLASGPFAYPDAPTATFSAKGTIASPALVDVDGDGKKDMLFLSIPFGVRNIVNFFVRGKLSARAEVYLFQDGKFASKPTFEEDFLLDAPDGRERVAYTLGDFSGDGRMDVAFGAGANKMDIFTSSPERLVSSRPWVSLEIPSFGIAHPCDLNGNKAKDMVLFHPGGANKKRIDVIVF